MGCTNCLLWMSRSPFGPNRSCWYWSISSSNILISSSRSSTSSLVSKTRSLLRLSFILLNFFGHFFKVLFHFEPFPSSCVEASWYSGTLSRMYSISIYPIRTPRCPCAEMARPIARTEKSTFNVFHMPVVSLENIMPKLKLLPMMKWVSHPFFLFHPKWGRNRTQSQYPINQSRHKYANSCASEPL